MGLVAGTDSICPGIKSKDEQQTHVDYHHVGNGARRNAQFS